MSESLEQETTDKPVQEQPDNPNTVESVPVVEVTPAIPVTDGVLDLRPEAGSVEDTLLRLGLTWDHVDETTCRETWCNYERHLAASFPASKDTNMTVTVTDTHTGQHADMPLARLQTVNRILVSGDTQ